MANLLRSVVLPPPGSARIARRDCSERISPTDLRSFEGSSSSTSSLSEDSKERVCLYSVEGIQVQRNKYMLKIQPSGPNLLVGRKPL